MKYRSMIKAGDLVKFYDFSKENSDYKKPRPALVLGYDPYRNRVNLMRITSKNNATEKEGYQVQGEEIRVPAKMVYDDDGDIIKELYGVVKTNNIIQVKRERLTQMSDVFSFGFKEKVLNKYKKLIVKPWYREYADYYCETHAQVMNYFHEDLIAEKLGFFKNEEGSVYDFIKHEYVEVEGIKQLHSNTHGFRYSVLFNKDDQLYEYTFTTDKKPKEIAKDWEGYKTVREWLHEDKKFHVLKNDLSIEFYPEPEIEGPYQSFHKFKRKQLVKDFQIEL